MIKRNLCNICNKKDYVVNINGLGLVCQDCFNKFNLDILGIDNTFIYPKTKTIKGYHFKLSHLILGDQVLFSAEGIGNDYYFRMTYPVNGNGQTAINNFLKKIEDGIGFKTINKDDVTTYLNNNGNVLISNNSFVIDGQKYSGAEFLNMLSPYEGFNLTFQINDITDSLLHEDEFLMPVKIDKETLINKIIEIINVYSDNGFIYSDDVLRVDLALFEVIDKFKYLYDHGDRDKAYDIGLNMLELLAHIQTDDDYFPINHLESICKVIDKYNENKLLSKYIDIFLKQN